MQARSISINLSLLHQSSRLCLLTGNANVDCEQPSDAATCQMLFEEMHMHLTALCTYLMQSVSDTHCHMGMTGESESDAVYKCMSMYKQSCYAQGGNT